jgi:hypothetical protein
VRGSADVSNWMHMFRWIVKLIRDEYGIPEEQLTRHAVIEKDIGLTTEQIEQLLEWISEAFTVKFPPGTLDELVRLEELCLLASWLAGLYKRPEFLAEGFANTAAAVNPKAAAA